MKEKIRISVQTLPNGFALSVDDQDYLYFNTRELLEGIFYHVGLEKTEYMDKQTIHDLMFAAATWPNAQDAVKDVLRLKAENSRYDKDNFILRSKISKLQASLEELQDKLADKESESKKTARTKKKNPTKADAAVAGRAVNLVEKYRNVYSHVSRAEAGPPKTKQHIKVSPDPQSIQNDIYNMLMTPILSLDLPTRVKSSLVIVGGQENKLLGDALCHSRHEFMMVRGCGVNVISILESWLAGHHLDFGMDVEKVLADHAKSVQT